MKDKDIFEAGDTMRLYLAGLEHTHEYFCELWSVLSRWLGAGCIHPIHIYVS